LKICFSGGFILKIKDTKFQAIEVLIEVIKKTTHQTQIEIKKL
jgi:hypothetical protein